MFMAIRIVEMVTGKGLAPIFQHQHQHQHQQQRADPACGRGGMWLGFPAEHMVAKELADGSLVRVLEDWCQPFAGYHLYYPNRREHSSAFGVVVEALLYKH